MQKTACDEIHHCFIATSTE